MNYYLIKKRTVLDVFIFITAIVVIVVIFSIPQFWRAYPLMGQVSTGNFLRLALLAGIFKYLSGKKPIQLNSAEFMSILTLLGYFSSYLVGYVFFNYQYDYENFENSEFYISLHPYVVFRGSIICIVIMTFFYDLKKINLLISSYYVSALLTVFMMRTGIEESVGNLLGTNILTERQREINEITLSTGDVFYRNSFWNLDPNYYSQLLAIASLFGIYFLEKAKTNTHKIFHILAVIVIQITIIQTGSRTGLFASVLSIIAFSVLMGMKFTTRIKIIFFTLITSYIFISYLYVNSSTFVARFVEPIADIESVFSGYIDPTESSIASRGYMAALAIEDYIQEGDLVFGSKGRIIGNWRGFSQNHAELINIVGQFGLITFIPYLFLLILLAKNYYRHRKVLLRKHSYPGYLAITNLALTLQTFLILSQLVTPSGQMLFLVIAVLLSINRITVKYLQCISFRPTYRLNP